MSTHVEWFSDPLLWIAEPGQVESDDYANEEAALVIEIPNDGDKAVIEVTEESYAAFAKRLREIADAFEAAS